MVNLIALSIVPAFIEFFISILPVDTESRTCKIPAIFKQYVISFGTKGFALSLKIEIQLKYVKFKPTYYNGHFGPYLCEDELEMIKKPLLSYLSEVELDILLNESFKTLETTGTYIQ